MTGIQFLKLVKTMREAQREYKRTNNFRLMCKLPLLEKAVDDAIEVYETAIEKTTPKQQTLNFDNPDERLEQIR